MITQSETIGILGAFILTVIVFLIVLIFWGWYTSPLRNRK